MKPVGLSVVAMCAVLLTGCARSNEAVETQKKLDEMQRQLAETQKKLQDQQTALQETAKVTTEQAEAKVEQAKRELAAARKGATSQVAAAQKKLAEAEQSARETRAAVDEARTEARKASADVAETRAEVKKALAPPPTYTLDSGTPITVRTTSRISTKSAGEGETFDATLEEPLEADGVILAPKGARVEGTIVDADAGGRVKGKASLTVGLRALVLDDGRRIPIRTSTDVRTAQGSAKKDAVKVGIASGIGAAIGAIAGGGKGAAIGAGVGAGAGTGTVLMTRGQAAEIPAETVLRFTLSSPVTIEGRRR